MESVNSSYMYVQISLYVQMNYQKEGRESFFWAGRGKSHIVIDVAFTFVRFQYPQVIERRTTVDIFPRPSIVQIVP